MEPVLESGANMTALSRHVLEPAKRKNCGHCSVRDAQPDSVRDAQPNSGERDALRFRVRNSQVLIF